MKELPNHPVELFEFKATHAAESTGFDSYVLTVRAFHSLQWNLLGWFYPEAFESFTGLKFDHKNPVEGFLTLTRTKNKIKLEFIKKGTY